MATHAAERRFVAAVAVADVAICFMTLSVVALMLIVSMQDRAVVPPSADLVIFAERPCEDSYVIGEGDALETVGDEDCGASLLVAVGENPHVVVDPADVVVPELVDFKLTPLRIRRL